MGGTRLLSQVSPTDWIRLRLTGDDPRVPLRVADVVPDGYERYIRLFHPVYTGDELLTWQQIADRTGTRLHPLAYFRHLLGDRTKNSVPNCSRARSAVAALAFPAITKLVLSRTAATATADRQPATATTVTAALAARRWTANRKISAQPKAAHCPP